MILLRGRRDKRRNSIQKGCLNQFKTVLWEEKLHKNEKMLRKRLQIDNILRRLKPAISGKKSWCVLRSDMYQVWEAQTIGFRKAPLQYLGKEIEKEKD